MTVTMKVIMHACKSAVEMKGSFYIDSLIIIKGAYHICLHQYATSILYYEYSTCIKVHYGAISQCFK